MSIQAPDNSGALAIDVQAVGQLKQMARAQSPAALKASAQQFEALFINMMLKSMRQASQPLGQNEHSDGQLYGSMFDQQLSQIMAQRGMGLADMMLRQLQVTGAQGDPVGANPVGKGAQQVSSSTSFAPVASQALPRSAGGDTLVEEFKKNMLEPAQVAARKTGLPVEFILGQAALESGWGKREIRDAQGQNSFNLFGIKATAGWQGATVDVTTTEYEGGQPRKVTAKFRAYNSYEQAFQDYATLLTSSKRYEKVLENGQNLSGFARGMQLAGYATDPAYAEKLTRIIEKNLLS
jgi:flagellar protein FlgJ